MKISCTTLSHDKFGCTNRPTVLCIDDDPDITLAIELMLARFDVNVIRDNCGDLGICDVFQEQPDIIITDFRMANGDGQKLLQQVKANSQTAHIPVIVLTGQRDSQLPGRMKNLGAAGFLHKPVQKQTLLNEIRRFVTLTEREALSANTDAAAIKA